MKPTVEELEQYKAYLIKNKLFNVVKDYAKDIIFDKILFKGDYDYNDEGGVNFHLGSVKLYKGGEEVVEYKSDEWQFFDQCWCVSELLGDYDDSYTLSENNLKEPFQLEIVENLPILTQN